jgi:hypothetical protein
MGGGASRGKDRTRGGDGRGTSQWSKVMGTHINAYPGSYPSSERNRYTLIVNWKHMVVSMVKLLKWILLLCQNCFLVDST